MGPHLALAGNGVTVVAGAREVDDDGAPVVLGLREDDDWMRLAEGMRTVATA